MNGTRDESGCRLFFALWPDAAAREALATWQTQLRSLCGGTAMRPDTLHTTLVFLGAVAGQRLEALKLAAQEVAFGPFEVEFNQVRYWGHNHIVYAAPAQAPLSLIRLVETLHGHLIEHGFRCEDKPYQPHVTLLRHAQWSDAPLPSMPPLGWRAAGFVLVNSRRTLTGAQYEVLACFPAAELAGR